MPEEQTKKVFALVNVDTSTLGDAAKQFVDVMKDAVTGICRPWQIRRVAEAEGDATLTEATVDIRVQGLYRRAAERWLNEEVQKQANMEAIASKAVPHIKASAQPHKIEPDWLSNFFAQARLFSDEDMQALWSKILAGEANSPGRFSKRAINAMGLLEKSDAARFQHFCRYVVSLNGEYCSVILPAEDTGVEPHPAGIYHYPPPLDFPALEEIGLIKMRRNSLFKAVRLDDNRRFELVYGSRTYTVDSALDDRLLAVKLHLGIVELTTIGAELAPICCGLERSGFVEYLQRQWQNRVRDFRPSEPAP